MDEARKICNTFLSDIDRFISDNLEDLTCSDMYNIYSNFYQDLKMFKGNSSGFTGLSEYLFFRFFYHHLGGSFNPIQITPDLYEFRSKDGKYRIGQSIPIKVGDRRYYPDIVIYKEDNLILVAEIKLYLTSGIKDLENDIKKLDAINKEYPGTKGLFISYNIIPLKGKIYKKLLEEDKSKEWFDYLILDKNNHPLNKRIKKFL